MKLKNIITVAGVMLSSLSLVSCEDFLTETNPNNITSDTFPESAKDCEKLLVATYNTFRDINNYSVIDENLRSDVAVNVGYNGVRQNPTKESALQDFTNSYSTILSKWAGLYTGVFASNQTLEAVEKVRPMVSKVADVELLDLIEAEGHLFRGLYYFWLHNGFNKGKVPLVVRVPETESDYYKPCSTSAEVIAFYRSELKKGLAKGLLNGWTDDTEKGRVTMYTALAVLGQSYLYQASSVLNNVPDAKATLNETVALGDPYGTANLVNEAEGISDALWTLITTPDSSLTSTDALYETAEAYFKAIIDSGKFTLDGVSVGDNMTTQGEFNKESILEVSYTTTYNSALNNSEVLYNTIGNSIADCPSSYESIGMPYWLVEQYESDPVDLAREDMNYVPIELADDFETTGDIVYEQMGEKMDRLWTSEDGTKSYDERYVMRIGAIGNYTATSYCLAKKLYTTDVETGVTTGPVYTMIGNTSTKFSYAGLVDQSSIRYINGVAHRRIQYSLRASYNAALIGDETLPYYKKPVSVTAGFQYATSGFFRKMTNWDIIDSEVNLTPSSASSVNLRLIRLADIYLLYAESLIKGGTDESGLLDAIDYVNHVRYRAGVKLIGTQSSSKTYSGYNNVTFDQSVQYVSLKTGEILRDGDNLPVVKAITDAEHLMGHIMFVERPLELSFEGHALRVNDIRRWNITKNRLQYLYSEKYVTQGFSYLYKTKEAAVRSIKTIWSKQYRPWEQPTQTTFYRDFQYASFNYNYDDDAYWPIPSSEVLSNPYIK